MTKTKEEIQESFFHNLICKPSDPMSGCDP